MNLHHPKFLNFKLVFRSCAGLLFGKQIFLNSAVLGDPGDGIRYHHYSRSKEHLNIELLKMFNGKTCRATNI